MNKQKLNKLAIVVRELGYREAARATDCRSDTELRYIILGNSEPSPAQEERFDKLVALYGMFHEAGSNVDSLRNWLRMRNEDLRDSPAEAMRDHRLEEVMRSAKHEIDKIKRYANPEFDKLPV